MSETDARVTNEMLDVACMWIGDHVERKVVRQAIAGVLDLARRGVTHDAGAVDEVECVADALLVRLHCRSRHTFDNERDAVVKAVRAALSARVRDDGVGMMRGLKQAAELVAGAAWRHEGSDAYSQGLDKGAREQVDVCVRAIDAEIARLRTAAPDRADASARRVSDAWLEAMCNGADTPPSLHDEACLDLRDARQLAADQAARIAELERARSIANCTSDYWKNETQKSRDRADRLASEAQAAREAGRHDMKQVVDWLETHGYDDIAEAMICHIDARERRHEPRSRLSKMRIALDPYS